MNILSMYKLSSKYWNTNREKVTYWITRFFHYLLTYSINYRLSLDKNGLKYIIMSLIDFQKCQKSTV